jgi:chromodomain-helicase-DNA-binding protein 4
MQKVDYEKDKGAAVDDGVEDGDDDGESIGAPSPVKVVSKSRHRRRDSDSDTDFRAFSEEESEPEMETDVRVQDELGAPQVQRPTGLVALPSNAPPKGGTKVHLPPHRPDNVPTQASPRKSSQAGSHRKTPISSKARPTKAKPVVISLLDSPTPSPSPLRPADKHTVKPFVRAQLPVRATFALTNGHYNNVSCPACGKLHPQGACELKIAGVEHCGLCGLAHYGIGRTCPHIRSETQVREMMQALKRSPESKELIDLAVKYLRGVKGTLVQSKKREREKALANAQGMFMDPNTMPRTTGPGASISRPPPGQYQHPYLQAPMSQAPMPHTPMHSGTESASASSSSGPAISAQQAQAIAQHRQAQDNQKRFSEHEAERALQEFLKGSR